MSPQDCDLRGYEYIPLFGHRLFNSIFDAKATDAEFRAALRLWWSCWQDCPAGSLPNDDDALCKAAGLGRDVKSWLKVKRMALHGFTECNDGRLYHKLICDQAKVAYEGRKKERDRKAKMRAERKKKEEEARDVPPDVQVIDFGQSEDVPRDSARTDRGSPTGRPEDVRSERRGEESKKESKQAACAGLRLPAAPFPEANLIETCAETQKAMAGGFYLDRAQERVFEAACIDDTKWLGDIKPLIGWMAAGIEPNTIVEAIRKVAERANYRVPARLTYFDQAVREAHGVTRR